MSQIWRMLAVVLTLVLIVAGAPLHPASAQSGRLQVVATFSILGDIVQNVAGDNIDLTVIVGPNGDAHTFEPNPEQIAAIADADLIIENGIGFEPWLDDMYEASGSGATRLVATDGLPLLAWNEDGHDHDEDAEAHVEGDEHDEAEHEAEEHDEEIHTADDGHDHGEHDPHVWHNVENVIHEVAIIRNALIAADPDNAADYTANADAYLTELQTLAAEVQTLVETLPVEQRILVTSHDALGYFADAYDFTIAGTALGSLSTEASDPSAGEIADLIEEIKATGVPAIFAENIENMDLMQQIADDAGVALAPTLYTDALSDPDGPASTYIAMMTYNASTIVTALGGAQS